MNIFLIVAQAGLWIGFVWLAYEIAANPKVLPDLYGYPMAAAIAAAFGVVAHNAAGGEP